MAQKEPPGQWVGDFVLFSRSGYNVRMASMLLSAGFQSFVLLLLILGVAVGVFSLLSSSSGWRKLAATYPPTMPFSGKMFFYQSLRMNTINIIGVSGGIDSHGLYFYAQPRFFFPPIFIPWNEITTIEPHHGTFIDTFRLTLRIAPHLQLSFAPEIFTDQDAFLPQRLKETFITQEKAKKQDFHDEDVPDSVVEDY